MLGMAFYVMFFGIYVIPVVMEEYEADIVLIKL
jgi:hypothetical protein